jgi:hypothetical protein
LVADGSKSLVFKELLLQNIQNIILDAPGLALAGSFCGTGFGVAPASIL